MNDDLIKRSDATNHCEVWRDRAKEAKDKEGWWMADNLLKLMKDTPTAEPKHGEWIVQDDNAYCSECGAAEDTFIYGSEYWHGLGLSHYCPNCGAKMKVVKR